uniref:gene transfer agent family protein n=1 Tax=uncultured Erythrobacter sp. TaxID=263913 RepID=UPI00262FFA93|nr:gene transfer agent family protein [uncultured Erythrobacter sp.]
MTQGANIIRGEAEISIAGTVYILRPSFENLVAAEDDLGSLFALVERASNGALTLAEITALLWHCLPDSTKTSRESVGQAVLVMGLIEAAKPVRTILAQVLQGQT